MSIDVSKAIAEPYISVFLSLLKYKPNIPSSAFCTEESYTVLQIRCWYELRGIAIHDRFISRLIFAFLMSVRGFAIPF